MPCPFPYTPAICECSWKETQIEKNTYVQINEETRVAVDSIRRRYNCSYLLLLGKTNLQSFEMSHKKFLLLWNMRLSLLSTALQ